MVVLAAVVLDNEHAALLHIVEHAAVGGGELRTRGVGANAEDDDVVGGEIASVDVRWLQQVHVTPMLSSDWGTSSPVPIT